MHLEVRHLKLVTAIADSGSVTRAAHRLHLTQSALSHQLKDIEERLGTRLFLRGHRRMVLSAAGERLLGSAHRILGELERVESDLSSPGAQATGLLRVTTECYTAYHWLPTVLPRFRAEWPNVEVRIVPDLTRRALAALLEGDVDVAIVSRCPENRRIAYTPLFADDIVIAVAPSHRLASRPFVRPSDLAREHLVVNDSREQASFLLEQVLRPAGVVPEQISRVPFTEAIVELVKAGIGCTAIARWAITPALEAGTLVAVPLTRHGCHRQWQAATRVAKTAPPHEAAFVTLLARSVGARATPSSQEAAKLPPRRSGRSRSGHESARHRAHERRATRSSRTPFHGLP